MIKRIAICLMLAGALAGGLVYAARARRALGVDAESELLSLAPADSALVAYADLAAIRNSPVAAQLGALAQPVRVDKDYTDFVSATGFDYSKDLDRVLITARSGAPSGDTLIFAEGRFDREKIEKYALRTGKQQTENGHTFYVVPLATAGKSLQFAFLSSGRMALANDGELSAAFSPAVRGAVDTGMRDRLARVSGAPLFAELKASNYVPQPGAAGAPGAPKGSPLATGMTAPFAALQWISLAARPDGDQIVLSMEGECKRPEDAQGVANALQFLRTILRGAMSDPKTRGQMPAQSAAAAQKLLETIKITTDAERVRLLVSLTPELLQLATNPRNGQQNGPASGPLNVPANGPTAQPVPLGH
jgi:hypothetical protein